MSKPVYRVTDTHTNSLLTELTGLQHRFLQEGLNPDDVIRTVRELRLRPQPFEVLAYAQGRWDDAWAIEDGFIARRGNDFWQYTDDGRALNFSIDSILGYRGYCRHPFGVLLWGYGQVVLHQFCHSVMIYRGPCDQIRAHPRGALVITRPERRTRVDLASWAERRPYINTQTTTATLLDNLSSLHRIFPTRDGILWLKHDGGWEYNREFVHVTPKECRLLFKGVGYDFLPHPHGVIVVNERQDVQLCMPEFNVTLYDGEYQAIAQTNGAEPVWGLAHPDGVILRHGKRLMLHAGERSGVVFEGQSFADACVDDLGRVLLRAAENKLYLCEVGCQPRLVSDVPHHITFGPHAQGAFVVENDRLYVCAPKKM